MFGCAVYNLNLERIPSSFRTDKAWLDLVDELGADHNILIKYTLAHIFAKQTMFCAPLLTRPDTFERLDCLCLNTTMATTTTTTTVETLRPQDMTCWSQATRPHSNGNTTYLEDKVGMT